MSHYPVISIIVPCYKSEPYIARCIESILCQSFTKWELLLIDDGSPDNTGKMCDEYCSRDKRIKVVHKKNEGVSAARNDGIEIANGEFLCFVDSDDYIKPDFLQTLYNEELRTNADLIVSGFTEISLSGKVDIINPQPQVYPSTKLRDLFENKQNWRVISLVWGKIFRKSIITYHHLKFNNAVSFGEDRIFMLNFLSLIDSTAIVRGDGYVYSLHEGSLSKTIKNFEEALNGLNAFRDITQKLSVRLGMDVFNLKYFQDRYIYQYGRILKSIRSCPSKNKRLQYYRMIEWDEYNSIHAPYSWREKILNKLLSLRFFRLYDSLVSLN